MAYRGDGLNDIFENDLTILKTCRAKQFIGDGSQLSNIPSPDVSGLVPYTGATDDLNLGLNKLIFDGGAIDFGIEEIKIINDGDSAYAGISIGDSNTYGDWNSVAIGNGAYTSFFNSIAIGRNAQTTGGSGGATAIGDSASASDYSIAIGYGASLTGSFGTAIGGYVSGAESIMIGTSDLGGVSGDYSLGVGRNVLVSGSGSVAIGNVAVADNDNQIVFYDGIGKQLDIYNGVADFQSNALSFDGGLISSDGNGLLTTQTLNIANIPTSSSGLSVGDVWSNSGVLTIV